MAGTGGRRRPPGCRRMRRRESPFRRHAGHPQVLGIRPGGRGRGGAHPGLRARASRHQGPRAADPVYCRSRKTPDIGRRACDAGHRAARQHVGAGARGAGRACSAGLAALAVACDRTERLLRRHLGDQRHRRHDMGSAMVRGHAGDLLSLGHSGERGFRDAAPYLASVARGDDAGAFPRGGTPVRHSPPDQRMGATRHPRTRHGSVAASRRRYVRRFLGRTIPGRVRFYTGLFRDSLAAPITNVQIANLYQSFGNGEFAMFISGPWDVGECLRRLPPSLQGRWMTAPNPATAGWPGHHRRPDAHSRAGRVSSCSADRHTPDSAWTFIEYLSGPAQQATFYRLSDDLPPRQSAWEDSALPATRTSGRSGAIRHSCRRRRSPGVGPDHEGARPIRAKALSAAAFRPIRARCPRPGSGARARETPVAARADASRYGGKVMSAGTMVRGDAGARAARRAAVIFLTPGLLLIMVTFLLPSVASFVLSLTDFDIYSVASPGNTRVDWLRNYAELARPRCSGSRSATRCTSCWSGDRCRVIVSLAWP